MYRLVDEDGAARACWMGLDVVDVEKARRVNREILVHHMTRQLVSPASVPKHLPSRAGIDFVAAWMRAHPGPRSFRDICAGSKVRHKYVRSILYDMVLNGQAVKIQTSRNDRRWSIVETSTERAEHGDGND